MYKHTHMQAGMCAVHFNLSNLIDGISEKFQLNVIWLPLQMHFEWFISNIKDDILHWSQCLVLEPILYAFYSFVEGDIISHIPNY